MARRKRPSIGLLIAHAIVMIGAVLMVLPMVWMIVTSFKPEAEIAIWPPRFLPKTPTFENYVGLFQAAPFGRYLLNSLGIALASTLAIAATSMVAGAIFGKYRFPGRTLFFGLIIATAIVPFETYMIPLYLQLIDIGWINTYQGIVLPYVIMAFGIFLMRQHVASAIPTELLEAARVDGGSEWWILRRVIAPLSGNALAAVGILAFIQGWTIFVWPLLMVNTPDLFNMELGLTVFQFAFSTDYGKLMAGSVISTIPMLVIFLFMRRRILESIALSGLK
jgi:multiple sugar transport system permease protein